VVASPHYLASGAGLAVLAAGGNAVDAAVATNLVLGVVCPYFCGVGGDLLAMVWRDELHAYRGVGRAPGAATVELVRDRWGSQSMPVFGPHAVTVPGAVDGWFALLDRFGTRSFGELARAAIGYAEDGFRLTRRGAWYFAQVGGVYASVGLDDFAAAYGAPVTGDVVLQPALARTLRALAEQGPDHFYRGPVGRAVAERIGAAGGVMTTADLAAHEGAWVTPLRAPFRDVEICEMPPPTQGLAALEALRIVDSLALPPDGPDRMHLCIEAMKLALADRDAHVGDPEWMHLEPDRLVADDWIAARRAALDPARAADTDPHHAPDGGTVYLCAADRDGTLVSLIQSNFFGAGCGLHVAEWGVNLHNRGSAFVLEPGHPNALAPRKMPLHTLIPALALRDGAPALVFGSEGGHTQAQTQLQLLVRMYVDGDDPQSALSAPRWTVDPGSARVGLEARFDSAWVEDLRRRGHEITDIPAFGHGVGLAHAIDCTGPGYRAASDPRAEGAALGL
jgi:gamma-glutamyltranspeptidase/glutathione hydrolase